MAQILGADAVGWRGMIGTWFQWLLIVITLVTIFIGSLYIIYSLVKEIRRIINKPKVQISTPSIIKDRFASLSSTFPQLVSEKAPQGRPASFGIYLGSFDSPPTREQSELLSRWDLTILDPLQAGVQDAISYLSTSGVRRFVARLDLSALLSDSMVADVRSLSEAISNLADTIRNKCSKVEEHRTIFTGLLLADWSQRLSAPVVCDLITFLSGLGFEVYVEASPPDFLQDTNVLRMPEVKGVVVKNATILPNGERRDFFKMDKMKPTLKAFVSESCMRDFLVMMWEAVDDNVSLSHAVLRRGYHWSGYYNALTCVTSTRGLSDASVNVGYQEPIGAFDWLKEATIMRIHKIWRTNTHLAANTKLNLLELGLPKYLRPVIHTAVTSTVPGNQQKKQTAVAQTLPRLPADITFPQKRAGNPLSYSPSGKPFTCLGCFPLGITVGSAGFSEVLLTQERLKSKGLLDELPLSQLQRYGVLFREFHDHLLQTHWSNSFPILQGLRQLSESLNKPDTDYPGSVQIYIGIDSGFHKGPDVRFWGVYRADNFSGMDLFISKKSCDLPSTILHTWLSSQGCPRHQCYLAELALAEWSHKLTSGLPPRLAQDIEMLSPSECLSFFRHLRIGDQVEDSLIQCIKSRCEFQLIDRPSLGQLKDENTIKYLSGKISTEDLIDHRVRWYEEAALDHPQRPEALAFFLAIDSYFLHILTSRKEDELNKLTAALDTAIKGDNINAFADLLALSLFCAARKFALEEVYLEVTDRNPLFNQYSDQAAVFAECFALGSQCDAYFDISPSAFGRILSQKFREYYLKEENQPPLWLDGAPTLASAYGAAQIDIDPDAKPSHMNKAIQFTFLSVFAIPALIDILMLIFTGRGLYLSAYMSTLERQSATLGLMIALLLSGAIGTWISVGSTYYLVSMAYGAMNMFIYTRLLAGVSFAFLIGIICLVFDSVANGYKAGLTFFLYLFALTTYFSILASLAGLQFPGSAFQSGRMTILLGIPILFVSPIITTFVHGYDTAIYICVIYVFVTVLLFGLRYNTSQWATWFHRIAFTNDAELKSWYLKEKLGGDEKRLPRDEPAILKCAREALIVDVMAERRRTFLSKSTSDELVSKLARSYEATNFLLDWYCPYSDTEKPIPFSSSWNATTKVAMNVLKQIQKGVRLHSAFVLWHQAWEEIGCGMLYFLLALLDKWIGLADSTQLLGLTTSGGQAERLAVGLGLAYYLIGAVILDSQAQRLHVLIGKTHVAPVSSAKDVRQAQKDDAKIKNKLYWKTLGRFLCWHVWSLSITASLVWTFQDHEGPTIMFLIYVFAYTGLLWYQYTKIFTRHALRPISIAVGISLPGGLIAKSIVPRFDYTDVIALAVATWTAAILTLQEAGIRAPKFLDVSPSELDESYHAYTHPWEDQDWSQQELKSLMDRLGRLPPDDCFKVEAEVHPGIVVETTLLNYLAKFEDPMTKAAFPEAPQCVERAIQDWRSGRINVELVPLSSITDLCPGVRGISCLNKDQTLKIMVGVAREKEGSELIDINRFCFDTAQILLHAVAENVFGEKHNDAYLMESLLSPLSDEAADLGYEESKRPLTLLINSNLPNASVVASRYWQQQALNYLCFGIRCDTEWDNLPQEIRRFFLHRSTGQVCHLSDKECAWLKSNFCGDVSLDVYIARCNFGAAYAILQHAKLADSSIIDEIFDDDLKHSNDQPFYEAPKFECPERSIIQEWLQIPMSFIGTCVKFFTFAIIADPEVQRELDYVLDEKPLLVRKPAKFFINGIWVYGKAVQRLGLPFFLLYRRDDVIKLWRDIQGLRITTKSSSIQIHDGGNVQTAFLATKNDGGYILNQFNGAFQRRPSTKKDLRFIFIFSKGMNLTNREEYDGTNLLNEYQYEYGRPQDAQQKITKHSSRFPLSRRCTRGKNEGQMVYYSKSGLIESGSYTKDGNFTRFKYHYRKHAQLGEELLRAEFDVGRIKCTVSWCAPPTHHAEKLNHWIPHSKVTEATFTIGEDIYECKWFYQEDRHNPFILTTLNGDEVDTPPLVQNDWLDILKKPKDCSFLEENPFVSFNSLKTNVVFRALGLNTRTFPISTSRARSQLWKAWKSSANFDGVIVRLLDERLLRRNKLLKPYWWKRDIGDILSAIQYADMHSDAIAANVDLDEEISSWTPLAMKLSDLFYFGSGGDAVRNSKPDVLPPDTREAIHVMALDSGTWPNEGGGVSACRRDLINNLKSIRWHMVVESATDFGVPKHQTEENVQSLKLIPLWGLDFLTPIHGIYQNRLHSEVQNVLRDVPPSDIERNFLPNLTALVKCARGASLSTADVNQCTRALVNINNYFAGSRHWGRVWTSDIVKSSWRNLWLAEGKAHGQPLPDWFNTELPTLTHLDTALELWFRYLFVLSIPIPEDVPTVFHASHHSVSAAYGVVCKVKRGCQLQIWDHAISWRETNLCLSSALCKLPPFVRNALLGLMRVTSVLALHHADVILPCCDYFNPDWEVEIGTCQGALEHRSSFARKVDPVVNGIPDMKKFTVIKEVESQKPTVTMLSHVWFAKDIKTALLAADIIVHEWGFYDYRLEIYGALDKAPTYSTECQELLASKALRDNVKLCGPSDAVKVLKKTHVFLNSSISEGLPLALGEAALTGAPIVCTDVGASRSVLTDISNNKTYSAIVAPNDAAGLARAQINLLALLGNWSSYANDPPGTIVPVLPTHPTPSDVEKITARMYAQAPQLRKLGILARTIIQHNFSGQRYLREHEQMLWVGKSRHQMTHGTLNIPLPMQRSGYATPIIGATNPTGDSMETIAIPRPALPPWRNSWRTSTSSSLVASPQPRSPSPGPSLTMSLGGSNTDLEALGGSRERGRKSRALSIGNGGHGHSRRSSEELSKLRKSIAKGGGHSASSSVSMSRSSHSPEFSTPAIELVEGIGSAYESSPLHNVERAA